MLKEVTYGNSGGSGRICVFRCLVLEKLYASQKGGLERGRNQILLYKVRGTGSVRGGTMIIECFASRRIRKTGSNEEQSYRSARAGMAEVGMEKVIPEGWRGRIYVDSGAVYGYGKRNNMINAERCNQRSWET
jgi:hypothetical protein